MKLSFGTVKITVVGGGKPMGGENNWFCIFEAVWGCMGTLANFASRQIKDASASFFARRLRLELATARLLLAISNIKYSLTCCITRQVGKEPRTLLSGRFLLFARSARTCRCTGCTL